MCRCGGIGRVFCRLILLIRVLRCLAATASLTSFDHLEAQITQKIGKKLPREGGGRAASVWTTSRSAGRGKSSPTQVSSTTMHVYLPALEPETRGPWPSAAIDPA